MPRSTTVSVSTSPQKRQSGDPSARSPSILTLNKSRDTPARYLGRTPGRRLRDQLAADAREVVPAGVRTAHGMELIGGLRQPGHLVVGQVDVGGGGVLLELGDARRA